MEETPELRLQRWTTLNAFMSVIDSIFPNVSNTFLCLCEALCEALYIYVELHRLTCLALHHIHICSFVPCVLLLRLILSLRSTLSCVSCLKSLINNVNHCHYCEAPVTKRVLNQPETEEEEEPPGVTSQRSTLQTQHVQRTCPCGVHRGSMKLRSILCY